LVGRRLTRLVVERQHPPVTKSLRCGDGGIGIGRIYRVSRGFHGQIVPHQNDLLIRIPKSRGSVTKTLVVSDVSSLLRNAPVMAVVLNRFFT
jgi:hypothetical protein